MSVTREGKVVLVTSVALTIREWDEIRSACRVFVMPVLHDLVDEAWQELLERRRTWRDGHDCDICGGCHSGAKWHPITASFVGADWHRSLVSEVRGYVNDGTVQRLFPHLHGVLADILLQIDE